MPVATRSNSVTNSSSVLRAHRNDAENAEEKHPRIPHHNLKERMKNLAMKAAPTHHPSVDLLGGVNSEEAENRNPKGLQTVLPVSARHDWDINLDRLGYSTCQRPAAVKTEHENTTKPLAARRLTMGGVVTRKGLGSIAEHGGDAGGGGARIMVYVRLRPISKKERDAGISSCVKIVNRKDVFITEFASETDYLRLKRIRGRHFMFDSAFPDSTSQEEVYNVTTADLVEGVLQGRNGSVFCYGATGAGKTYTMLGTVSNPGVMVLAIKDLFKKIRQRSLDGEHSVHLSYLEVYNETVRDLLSPGRPLVLREDKQGIVAAGLTQYKAFSTEEVMALLQRGNQSRTTEPTRMNETSSRSHAILQVVAEFKYREGSSVFSRHGKLSLIDLAGSERALATDLRTVRSLEGANINRSLLALSSCINALVEGKKHIPYRNSKLTQLLKDSLGGACHTVMIANISPSNQTFGETQNTLHWADRAKEIRTKACTTNDEFSIPENQGDQVKLLLEVQKENQQLRKQLTQFKQKAMTLQNQLLATASASNCPTPMACSPSPSKSQISEINQLKNTVYPGTPESIKKQKPTCDVSKTPEDVVRELKRKIRSLEEDNQNMCKEFSMKENKFKASIDHLQREHALQLQKKDEFIRQLCPKSSYQDHKPSFHSDAEETPNFTRPSDKNKSVKATVAISCTSSRPPTDRSRRGASQKPPIPYEASDRKGKRVQSGTEDLRDIRSPKASYRFQSPAANPGKKRTFDDITNANSPSTLRPRTTRRSQAACDAPSMLLQPGFARHRLTPSK